MSVPPDLRECNGRRLKKIVTQREWRIPEEQRPLSQIRMTDMQSWTLTQKSQDLHWSAPGLMLIYCSYYLSIFMEH